MTTRPVRQFVTAIVLVLTISFGSLATTSVAGAQADVVGTADFRNAPILPPGQFIDQIVSGDTAWYSFVYTNDTPYRFAVALRGGGSSELDLRASFVAPTLETVAGPDDEITGSGVVYPSGNTNVWFLKVTLETSGTPGVEYQIVLDIEGVESARIENCSDLRDCTLAAEFAAIDARFTAVSTELDEALAQESTDAVRQEIDNLQGFFESAEAFRPAAEARLARAEATMAELCSPDLTCIEFPDPPSKTPLLGWLLGALAIGGGAYRLATKPRSEEEADGVKPTEAASRRKPG